MTIDPTRVGRALGELLAATGAFDDPDKRMAADLISIATLAMMGEVPMDRIRLAHAAVDGADAKRGKVHHFFRLDTEIEILSELRRIAPEMFEATEMATDRIVEHLAAQFPKHAHHIDRDSVHKVLVSNISRSGVIARLLHPLGVFAARTPLDEATNEVGKALKRRAKHRSSR